MTNPDRVESLFAAALELPREQRRPFVLERAVDDAERDEVLSLLGHHDSAASGAAFLDTPAARIDKQVVDDLGTDDAPAEGRDDFLPRIEGFDVLEVLGRGGMGVVYRAAQRHPRRFVALKVVDPVLSSPSLLQRLRREAESLGRLEHPGIARLYQAGASGDADARPWFAMELVDGQPLLEFAATRRLGRRERVELLARIADAVHYAHTRGVVHRDLKPANVLVVDDPTTTEGDPSADHVRGARPKILDFGVARLTGSNDATHATEPGRLLGTLGWMSPEQCDSGREVDARTDVYALGVMAYELLGERHPYELAGLTLAAALRTIQEVDPPPLSTLDERLRGDLDTIVAKAIEKDPARRYATAAEFAADLRRHLRDEPIAARPATTLDRALRFGRRHRVLVGMTAVTVVALLTALLLVSREATRAGEAERLAAEERDAARESERDMREALALLDEIVLASDPYRQGRADVTMTDVLIQAAADLEQRTDLRPRVRAHVTETVGRAFHGLRQDAQAVRWLDEARRTFVALDGTASPDAVRAGAWLAASLADDGRLDDAQHLLDSDVEPHLPPPDEAPLLHHRARLARVRLARQRGEPEVAVALARDLIEQAERFALAPETIGAARSHLVRALSSAGRHSEAYELAELLLAEREARHGREAALTLGAVEMLLREADALGRVGEAADLAERALASLPLLGPTHEDRVVFLQIAAKALRDAGRFEPAEVAIDEAIRASAAANGERHPTTLALRNSRVLLWQELGRPEAPAELQELFALCEQELGACDLTAAMALNLAERVANAGDYERALSLQRGALEWYEASVGGESPEASTARAQTGATLLLADRLDEAFETLTHVHEEQVRRLGADHPLTLDTANNLAVTLKRLGRLDEAEPLFASLVESAARTYPEGHARRGIARLTWGLCLLAQERFPQARDQLERSHDILSHALPAGHPYRRRALEALVEWSERAGSAVDREVWAAELDAESL